VFIPIGDTPNPRDFRPWVNWGIITVNIVIYIVISYPLSMQAVNPGDPALHDFLLSISRSLPSGISLREILTHISRYDLYVFLHGYKPGMPEWNDLFFSMFLHAGFLHLAGNMLFLWIYGDNVEFRLGRATYLAVYIGTGIAATLFFSAFSTSSTTPLIGASGAISGVLGLYFLLFPRNKIKMFIALFPFYFDVVHLPSRLVLAFYLIIDNLLPFFAGSESGVAHGAHIGGFIAGLAIAALGERLSWNLPWKDRIWFSKNQKNSERPSEQSIHGLKDALHRGDASNALEAFPILNQKDLQGLSPIECVKLARWLDNAGHNIAATTLLRRCLAANPKSQDLAVIFLELGLMRLNQGQPTAAYQHLLSVFDHNPTPQIEQEARLALNRIHMHKDAGPH